MTDTQVEAQVGSDGKVTVASFTWRGRIVRPTSQGRQWDAGGRRHVLVMAAGEQVFELAGDMARWAWEIVSAPEGPRAA